MANIVARFVALVASVALTVALVEALLHAYPPLIPLPVFYQLPGGGRYLQSLVFDQPVELGFRYKPNQDVTFSFGPDDPTILQNQAEDIALRDDPTVYRLRLQTDENGFINPSPTRETYGIVMTGDSFMGLSAEEHWVDWIMSGTSTRVLNLGMPGWGPQAEAAALRRYGVPKQPKEMLLAYFEGNDLWDAAQYEARRASGLSWVAYDLRGTSFVDRLVLPKLVPWSVRQAQRRWADDAGRKYRYPRNVEAGGRPLALVFADLYVMRLTTPRADIEGSQNFAWTAVALRAARDAAAAAGARLTVVYIPSEEHVYLPLIQGTPHVEAILPGLFTVRVGPDGLLGDSATPVDAPTLYAHLDDQRQAVLAFLAREGIPAVDLTPAFAARAAAGEALYNYADTHWNAAGHKLAAQAVSDHLNGVAAAPAP